MHIPLERISRSVNLLPDMSRSLRFLQISDLHLDSSLASGRLALPRDKRERINHDMVRALVRAVSMAVEAEVDVILIPGDVWDDESVTMATAAQFFDVLAKAAPIPVVIVPGNHDPWHVFSYYNPAYYQERVGHPHPSNVHIFNSPSFSSMQVPGLRNVTFYGCCFTENRPRRERCLQELRAGDGDGLHVLLLHGSQDDGVAPNPEAFATAPFSRDEILACGYDYTALGHYHRYSDIRDDRGMIRAAYGGIPVARGLDETGDHFVLLGEIEKGGVRPDSLVQEYVDVRHVKKIAVEIDRSVVSAHELQSRISNALREAGTTVDDMVYVNLQGYSHPDVDTFGVDPEWRAQQCFHLVIDQSQLIPDYEELEESADSDKHVEGRFNQRMVDLLHGAQGNEEQVRLVRLARSLGLDALRGREVKPRNVY